MAGFEDNENRNGKSKSKMRGFLHCVTHGETVSDFGRNDAFFLGSNDSNGKGKS